MCIYIYIYHVYICMYIQILLYVYIYIYIYVYIHIHIHIYIYIYVYTKYTDRHMYIYIYIYIPTSLGPFSCPLVSARTTSTGDILIICCMLWMYACTHVLVCASVCPYTCNVCVYIYIYIYVCYAIYIERESERCVMCMYHINYVMYVYTDCYY